MSGSEDSNITRGPGIGGPDQLPPDGDDNRTQDPNGPPIHSSPATRTDRRSCQIRSSLARMAGSDRHSRGHGQTLGSGNLAHYRFARGELFTEGSDSSSD